MNWSKCCLFLTAILLIAVAVSAEDPKQFQQDVQRRIDSLLALHGNDYTTMSDDSLRQFAEAGVDEAQFMLGYYLLDPALGVSDHADAVEWLHKSADQDYPPAMEYLASLFYSGTYVEKNIDSALYWTTQAAQLDYAPCQATLAMYTMGTAMTSADSSRSYMWVRLATQNVYNDAMRQAVDSLRNQIGNMLTAEQRMQGDSMMIDYLTDRLEQCEDRRDSIRTIRNLSKAGSAEGKYLEGTLYFFPDASDTTLQIGLALYKEAAVAGHAHAAFKVGELYNWGLKPVTMNLDSAIYWLTRAVTAGDADAAVSLGYNYTAGRGVKKDAKEGVRLLKFSAAQNNTGGIHELGNFYWSDRAPKKNAVRAWALLNVAKDRFKQVDILKIGESIRKMNDKERIEAEQLRKDLNDDTKIKGIIEGWKD